MKGPSGNGICISWRKLNWNLDFSSKGKNQQLQEENVASKRIKTVKNVQTPSFQWLEYRKKQTRRNFVFMLSTDTFNLYAVIIEIMIFMDKDNTKQIIGHICLICAI